MWKCQQSLRKIQHPTALLDEHLRASASSCPKRHLHPEVSSAFCGIGRPLEVDLLAAETHKWYRISSCGHVHFNALTGTSSLSSMWTKGIPWRACLKRTALPTRSFLPPIKVCSITLQVITEQAAPQALHMLCYKQDMRSIQDAKLFSDDAPRTAGYKVNRNKRHRWTW